MLECIKHWISLRKGKTLTVKTAPRCYNPYSHTTLHDCYLNTGFYPIRTLANHYIPVSHTAFQCIIKPSEKRRLRKSKTAGLSAVLNSTVSTAEAYSFLKQCRECNGYSLSISLFQLEILRLTFPDKFLIFTVFDETKIVALTVAVFAGDQILYLFLSAYLQAYSTYSPHVLLVEKIYEYCQQHDINILDLGISLDSQNAHKDSLSRFKENIGGKECEKVTYRLKF